MNQSMVNVEAPFAALAEPLMQTHQLLISQCEKGMALGMNSLKAYVDLAAAQVTVALKIRDSYSLHEFADSQFAVLSFVGHRLFEDIRALGEWEIDACQQAQGLLQRRLLRCVFKD